MRALGVRCQALALRKASYEAGAGWISGATLSKRLVTEAKTNPETAFLAEVSAVVLQQALRDSDSAYKNFFDSATGRRKGSRIGEVAVRWSRSLPTEASSGTVIRDASGLNVSSPPSLWSRTRLKTWTGFRT